MRLQHIKLSGFKSFVDPSVLKVSDNLVGIVGPNGCGKSNLIDAVTWVMGESSAKHLRGDSLTDVIFNGSSSRKPIGQASVELVFDNTVDKIGGQYAAYDEISIKRQINRDAVSTYYLNGTRCRRRDITGIFLGTGLGPRSYSIIEQGMISRLIEAKPEELRVYIEEAAGISKYRERRRETENRIKHTKENLNRINDIREELDRQLKTLQRQAKAAERYQVLKKEERELKVELLALNWQELDKETEKRRTEMKEKQNRVEEVIANLRKVEAEIEEKREELAAANTNLNETQSNFYQISGDISNTEQKIQHIQERINRLESEKAENEQNLEKAQQRQAKDQEQLALLEKELEDLKPKLDGYRAESDKAYSVLNESEKAMQSWESEWDTFNESMTDFVKQQQTDRARSEFLQNRGEELTEREAQLKKELEEIASLDLSTQISSLTQSILQFNSVLEKGSAGLTASRESLLGLRNSISQTRSSLDEKRTEQQKVVGKLSSLEALQQESLSQGQEQFKEWLSKQALDNKPRLAQQIKIDEKWSLALETVLGDHLQAIAVDDFKDVVGQTAGLKGRIELRKTSSYSSNTDQSSRFPRLIDQIDANISLPNSLQNIYVADSLDEAIAELNNLDTAESFVTQDGVWIAKDWVIINRKGDDKDTLINRERDIETAKKSLEKINADIESLEKQLQSQQSEFEDKENEIQSAQSNLQKQTAELSEMKSALAGNESRLQEVQNRQSAIEDEIEQIIEDVERFNDERREINRRLESVADDQNKLESQKLELSEQREKFRVSLEESRQRWQSSHEESHGVALQLESFSSRKASLEQGLKREDIQITHLTERISVVVEQLVEQQQPLEAAQQTLKQKLDDKISAEKLLSAARDVLQRLDELLKQHEQERHKTEQTLEEARGTAEKARIRVNESEVRLTTIQEQLDEQNSKAKEVLEAIEGEADIATWQEKLESINRKIQRLGAINLAAIDEFKQLSERKEYLDSQNADLLKAMETLEGAIRKIDKETRTRFKETFDTLNTNLKEMFPKLFGGGHAYLELTGDDLLQTGVAIMARPPGKKNSNIHLLSGGEKALTAVALVFAIFKLNPSPFCILDEVDAPLDDSNTARFANMVKEMSSDIQFMVITHNKITMEVASQLFGVTMQEAGVSRLVSVDMNEAAEMTATG